MEGYKTSEIIAALQQLVEKNGDLNFTIINDGERLDFGNNVLHFGHAETFFEGMVNYLEIQYVDENEQ